MLAQVKRLCHRLKIFCGIVGDELKIVEGEDLGKLKAKVAIDDDLEN